MVEIKQEEQRKKIVYREYDARREYESQSTISEEDPFAKTQGQF